ncbi:MAG: penicillin-binding protein 2 [Rickettsiales bacterium]|nr:penicillin-binding protein 2 [Rickettsiales bacterium]
MKQLCSKVTIIISCVAIIFSVIVARIFYLTIIRYDKSFDKKIFYDPVYKRVDVVDRNNVVVASNIKVKTLYLNKDLIDNEKFIAKELSRTLDLDYDFIYKKITNKTKSKYILIKKNIFPAEENILRQLPIASLIFEDDLLRFYPHNNLFSHVLGYVDADKEGVIGIEEYYNDYLKNIDNKPIKLTMDLRIQEALRDELLKAQEKYKANFVVGILMEIKTGNVLGMVSLPDFNPNKIKDGDNTFNFATYGNYELGSVFKMFTFANAVENNLINENTKFDVSKELNFGNYVVKDIRSIMSKKEITAKEGFSTSSNLVASQIAKRIGVDKQLKFFEELGLLEKLNININQRVLPLQPRKWRDINLITISYGYGIAVSPLHVISATNGILNDGKLITPRFTYDFDKQIAKQVVSHKTSVVMRQLFKNAVINGTGKLVYIDGLNIGGKTGTARKNSKSGYQEGEHIASFVGAFPIDNPQYSIFVVADRPKVNSEQDGTGGGVATVIAREIILKALPFLDLKPAYK